ncbi:type 1 glutamine amidotransferase family protein [Allostreptomyces psammosilenae]|uniref:Putative intracellular protease/amidase n=1 Tax=Allostreptomyces psammosilenae TaxID=1892865 RepID=A0A853AA37_9ACTN|nr:type 1 glutamine amidotransferase family protein [Allostreptomyces psammosilenae]NYI07242.1 putative intracellular protease/amidase [Allostreptomyces psammosilenae]
MTTTEHPTRTVHLAIYDDLADWEVGHAVAHIRNGAYQRQPGRYDVRTVGETGQAVTTMGGVRLLPDLTLAELEPDDSAMLILPGAGGWDRGEHAPFARKARAFLDAGVPVAAICGATAGLAREGLLDDRAHTSAALEYLAATGYAGSDRYREAAAVTDAGLVTAGPTAPVEFAREILAQLDTHEPEVLDAWYRLFAQHDPTAYGVLMAAGAR